MTESPPGAREGLLHCRDDFVARHQSPAVGNARFEQGDNLTGGYVRVKLPGDAEQPSVNTLTGARRTGEQVLNKWRRLAGHASSF
jgi:hypothetical protein